MARLESSTKKEFAQAIAGSTVPLIAFGLDAAVDSPAERMEGMAGLLDWTVHGQVSRLLAQGRFPAGEFCLVAGDPEKKRPSLLGYHYDAHPDVKKITERLKDLQVKEIGLAESTFPGDFLGKLKQTLKKEGIGCTKLEP